MRKSLLEKIAELKERCNAVILAHNYQSEEVQVLADYLGDSLELSRQAARTDAEVIVFCGVQFMAETAFILSPQKRVLIPDPNATCPMAGMMDAARLRELKAAHPEAVVVCYVNSTAEVKAESDVCCTSANACEVVNSIPEERPIIFVPDKYLGLWSASQTGRQLILSNGYCPTHVRITPERITQLKQEYPDARVTVHPECLPSVTAMADLVASTGGMVRYARESEARRLIVGTEEGLLHRLRRENPDKQFILASAAAVCPNMKLHSAEKVLWSLQEMQHEVKVPEDVRRKALGAIERMLAIGRDDSVRSGTPLPG